MLSARKVVSVLLLLLFTAIIGAVTIALGYQFGRYLVYVSVPVGAVLAIVSAVSAMLGKLEQDLGGR